METEANIPAPSLATPTPAQELSGGFVRRSIATASTRLLDLPTRYGLHLLVAARLPIDQVGAFYIVFSVMTLASGFGRLGVDRAVTREVAAALGRDNPAAARKAIVRGFWYTLLQSGVIFGLLALLRHPIADHVLHKPNLAVLLLLGAITILPQNMANAAAGALAGMGRVATSQMIYQWMWPGMFCIAALSMKHLDVYHTLALIIVCLTVTAVVGIGIMLRVLPRKHQDHRDVPAPALFGLGLHLFSLELVQLAISSAPSFVLGMVASTVEVGQYALAWRIVLVLNLLVSAMGAMASPQFARANAIGDRNLLRSTAAQSVGLAFGLSALPAILLAVNPVFFLHFFGSGYAPAAPALRILLIGQFSMIACAAVPEMLGMTDHARSLMKINMGSLIFLCAGLAAFTPHFGSIGAAIATALTMLMNAFAVSWAAKRYLNLIPLLAFFQDIRGIVRQTLQPATASDSPSPSEVQANESSAEAHPEFN